MQLACNWHSTKTLRRICKFEVCLNPYCTVHQHAPCPLELFKLPTAKTKHCCAHHLQKHTEAPIRCKKSKKSEKCWVAQMWRSLLPTFFDVQTAEGQVVESFEGEETWWDERQRGTFSAWTLCAHVLCARFIAVRKFQTFRCIVHPTMWRFQSSNWARLIVT